MNKRPLILITNDDGINAKGILELTETVLPFGDCVVVAPNSHRSGQSHAVTVVEPIFVDLIEDMSQIKRYSCSGTPVDCVKIGAQKLLPRRPDLIVSGINHGSNASSNIAYSGTMGAAIEGAMLGIPSIGFSLCDFSSDAHFLHTKPFIEMIVKDVLDNGLHSGVCLNVNFPKLSDQPIKGIRVCSQGEGVWNEEYELREDPRGRNYFWIKGHFQNGNFKDESDLLAIEQNYVSLQPVNFDFTAFNQFDHFKSRFNNV